MQKIIQRLVQDIKNYYIGVLIFMVYSIVVRHVFHAFCPLLIFTGIPCAGCGMTRAVYCIFTGQVQRGMDLNPAAPLGILGCVCWGIERYVLGRNRKWILYLVAFICIVTLLIYGYRMSTQFPSYPPMTYYKRNLLSKYCTFYHNLLQYIWDI